MNRRREWMLAAVCLGLLLALQLGWSRVIAVRSGNVATRVTAGQAWTSDTGARFRLARLQTSGVKTVDDDGKAVTTPDGTTLVAAIVEVAGNRRDDFCGLVLVGRDGREWEPDLTSTGSLAEPRGLPVSCSEVTGDGRVGRVFLVPRAEVANVEGVRVEAPGTDRHPVILLGGQ